jgi:protein involved in polysaccharide export with SLBB domain
MRGFSTSRGRLFELLALPVLLLKKTLRHGCAALLMLLALVPAAAQTGAGNDVDPGGPIRLRQPASPSAAEAERARSAERERSEARDELRRREREREHDGRRVETPLGGQPRLIGDDPVGYRPGEFELFVRRLVAPLQIRRYGAELMAEPDEAGAADYSPLVPPDYLISAGDELIITLWGSVDADLRLQVDRSGRIAIPRVGPVMVAGVRYGDLPAVISRRVGQVFRNFELSVSLAQLRGVRVYVTGYVARPGAYTVNSLATVSNALLKAGGPSSAGSFRQIQLRRANQVATTLDLYDLLLKGERAGDVALQAGDVIHVGAIGTQVAMVGSVNKPAIFELKAGETAADVLRMAGGFTAVADRSRLAVERLDERSSTRIAEIVLPTGAAAPLGSGDVLRAFSAVDSALPVQRQNKRVRVEGEVQRPGEYVLPPQSSVADAVAAAGGLTASAYVFGTEFNRESVRITQQENYERALRDLETEMTRAATTTRASTADEAAAQQARSSNVTRLVERLRAIRPNGRIVLQLPPESRDLPNLALEDGDRIYVPPRSTTVGVFGSVFNGGSYLYNDGRSVEDYLRLAGGPTRGADSGSTFVIRANGTVVSGRQVNSGWFGGDSLQGVAAQPGDTIFVPEEVNKTTLVQNLKDWTQILSQFGLGIAAIKTLGN